MRSTAPVRAVVCGVGCVLLTGSFGAPAAQHGPEPPPAVSPSSPGFQSDTGSQRVFRGGTEAVLVDVYPQRDGRIVEGLTAGQFHVLEDGKPQQITSFEFVHLEGGPPDSSRQDPNTVQEMRQLAADPHHRVFVVFLDRGHTTVDGASRIQRPLGDMLDRMIGAEDLFGVMLPEMRPADVTLGRRTLSIEAQLGDYWPWGARGRLSTESDKLDPMEDELKSCFEYLQPKDPTAVAREWYVPDGGAARRLDDILIERRREDRTLQSLENLVRYLGALREARSVVIAVTDGWVLFGPDPTLQAQPALDQRLETGDPEFAACSRELNRLSMLDDGRRERDLIQLANRNNVSFYPIASGGLAAFDTDMGARVRPVSATGGGSVLGWHASRGRDRVDALKEVAEGTDGIAVVNTNDLSAGAQRIVDDVSAYYLLTYVPTNEKRDGRYRKIEVHVDAPGLSVRARRGYVAASAEADAKAEAAAPPGPPPVPAGLTEALGMLAHRPAAQAYVYGALAGDRLRVAVELPAGPSGRAWAAGTDVTATAATQAGDPAGTATAPLDVDWRDAALALPAPAGPGPWVVTVTVGEGADRVREQVMVTRPTDALLGAALVSRGNPSPRSPLRPVASFTFSRRERIHVAWPVLAAIDRQSARLLNTQGQPVPLPVTVARTDGSEGPVVTADLTLGPLAVGDYVIEITAGAGDRSAIRYVAFRIAP